MGLQLPMPLPFNMEPSILLDVNDSDIVLPSDTSSWSITATFNVSCAERSNLRSVV
jgi:hypothetical protein